MKNLNNAVCLILSVLALSACGSSVSSTTSGSNTAASNTANSNPYATPTPNNGGNIYNLPAAPEQTVQLSGNGGGSFSKSLYFQTSRTLKVKIEALPAPNMTVGGYTNWVFVYGCMSVSVTVNGVTQTTSILQVAGMAQPSSECSGSASSTTLDFSNVTTGNGPITVTMSNPNYDNCRYYSPSAYGCGMTAVWQNHQVAFNATVQTDATYMAP